jgi:DNA-binding NarL/FixJ family response regulator
MIKITVIEDDSTLRNSLETLINTTSGFQCVGSYNSCETALKKITADKPDVVLMDIELAGQINGIEGVKLVKGLFPDVHVIMLTVHEDNESVFNSLKNGASGYLIKNASFADILGRIKEALDGGAPMSMTIAKMVISSFCPSKDKLPFSERELEVLEKLVEGKSYQAIANQLFIEKTTVKFHIGNIYKKLHVANKAEAIIKVKDSKLLH